MLVHQCTCAFISVHMYPAPFVEAHSSKGHLDDEARIVRPHLVQGTFEGCAEIGSGSCASFALAKASKTGCSCPFLDTCIVGSFRQLLQPHNSTHLTLLVPTELLFHLSYHLQIMNRSELHTVSDYKLIYKFYFFYSQDNMKENALGIYNYADYLACSSSSRLNGSISTESSSSSTLLALLES